MSFRRTILGLIATSLFLPTAALAQNGDGITVDPNSPSAKEYEVPTQQTRNEASGHTGKVDPNKNDKAPLFGEGVQSTATPTPTATVSTTATSTSKDSARRKAALKRKREAEERARKERERAQKSEDKKAVVATTGAATPSPPASVPAAAQTPSGGATSWLLIGGILALVVIIGAAAGIPLRRRARQEHPRGTGHPDPASAETR